MRRRGARESRKKKPNKSRGNGTESYLSSPPLSLSAHKRFQLLLFLFLQKKKKKKNSFNISLYCPQQSDRHIWVCIWHQSDHSIEVCLR